MHERRSKTAVTSGIFPDFNPIEKDWANMKRTLRNTAAFCDLLQTAIYNYWC
jgi:transposase